MLSIIPGMVYDMPVTLDKKSYFRDFPGGSDGKKSCLLHGKPGFNLWVRKIATEFNRYI